MLNICHSRYSFKWVLRDHLNLNLDANNIYTIGLYHKQASIGYIEFKLVLSLLSFI